MVYDRTTITLHWATATLVPVLWVLGQTADWFPDGPVNTAVWSVHVTLGFAITGVLAGRIAWRASNGRGLPAADSGALQFLAKATHYLLYGLLIVVALSGVINAFVHGYDMFDLFNLPQVGDLAWRRPITQWHGLAANILLGLALFHASAALLHHHLWRDGVLGRMLPANAARERSDRRARLKGRPEYRLGSRSTTEQGKFGHRHPHISA